MERNDAGEKRPKPTGQGFGVWVDDHKAPYLAYQFFPAKIMAEKWIKMHSPQYQTVVPIIIMTEAEYKRLKAKAGE